jgi:hypothetical protein
MPPFVTNANSPDGWACCAGPQPYNKVNSRKSDDKSAFRFQSGQLPRSPFPDRVRLSTSCIAKVLLA